MKRNSKVDSAKAQKRIEGHLETINLYAAGIDIGSESHYVAVPEELDDQPVREFPVFTADLENMTQWLIKTGITTVVMESTGVYWIPAFEMLEAHGLEVHLVNARHVKNVSGRKTDVQDCQWLQQLHTYGLLKSAFRPEEQVCALRAYMRQRDNLVHLRASHIQHMQKALRQMNLLLENVVSDITGLTGMTIIRAVINGERNPRELAKNRDHRCKRSEAEIAKSLQGHYRQEHLFALKQAVELYDVYNDKIKSCDQALENQLKQFDSEVETSGTELSPATKKRKSGSSPGFDVRSELYRMTGVDLTAVDGIDECSALTILSETGTDMSRWPTVKHFASWLGLSPENKITGGRVLSCKTKRIPNRAAKALRVCAYALANSKSALGGYYRRMRSRLGAPKAITATAHKLARFIYSMLKNKTAYVDLGQDHYDQEYRERVIKSLKKKAKDMGYQLISIEAESGS